MKSGDTAESSGSLSIIKKDTLQRGAKITNPF